MAATSAASETLSSSLSTVGSLYFARNTTFRRDPYCVG